LPFSFGIRVELFHRNQARERERRELACAIAEEIGRRTRANEGRAHDLDAPKNKAGRKRKLQSDVELLREIRRDSFPPQKSRQWARQGLGGAVGERTDAGGDKSNDR
jgi:hypothetical protein